MEGSTETRQAIDNAEQDIQRELTNGSGNPWLACFGSILAHIRSTLEIHYDGDAALPIHARLDEIVTKRNQVKEEYGWDPPQAIQEVLLGDLKRILE
ncbi:MAG: hypothetical protein PHU04_04120 [Candidatus Peribacteraceae bacterium]|nr:hypothetical protein [Candidatus Peribacteraceae bacterium]